MLGTNSPKLYAPSGGWGDCSQLAKLEDHGSGCLKDSRPQNAVLLGTMAEPRQRQIIRVREYEFDISAISESWFVGCLLQGVLSTTSPMEQWGRSASSILVKALAWGSPKTRM